VQQQPKVFTKVMVRHPSTGIAEQVMPGHPVIAHVL